jgi:hypothetical protein
MSRIKCRWIGFIGVMISAMFVFKFITKASSVSGAYVWWNNWRLVHGITYGAFAILQLLSYKYAYVPILIDTILGIIAYLIH